MEQNVLATLESDSLWTQLSGSWYTLRSRLAEGRKDLAVALADGRQIMFSLAWVVSGALLAHEAQRDNDATAVEVATRWILDGEGGVGEFGFPGVVHTKSTQRDGRDRINRDCRLVWGVDLPEDAAAGYRLSPSTSSGEPEKLVAKL